MTESWGMAATRLAVNRACQRSAAMELARDGKDADPMTVRLYQAWRQEERELMAKSEVLA